MKIIARGFLILIIAGLAGLGFAGCGKDNGQTEGSETEMKNNIFEHITPKQAKALMDSETGYIILDVRTKSEYDEGHIENALLIPDNEISIRAESELTDKNQLILVYCRSGRRSKLASQALSELGYTNIKEFGGIIDWPYETVK